MFLGRISHSSNGNMVIGEKAADVPVAAADWLVARARR